VLGDASVGAGSAAGLSARRDIARRGTGPANCTMAITDAGMLIKAAMKAMKSAGVPVSHAQDMGSRLPTPGASGMMPRRGNLPLVSPS
jgi:hypothetical protein